MTYKQNHEQWNALMCGLLKFSSLTSVALSSWLGSTLIEYVWYFLISAAPDSTIFSEVGFASDGPDSNRRRRTFENYEVKCRHSLASIALHHVYILSSSYELYGSSASRTGVLKLRAGKIALLMLNGD